MIVRIKLVAPITVSPTNLKISKKYLKILKTNFRILKKLLLNIDGNSIPSKLNSLFTPFPEILTVPKAPIYFKTPSMNSKSNNALKTKLSDLIGN